MRLKKIFLVLTLFLAALVLGQVVKTLTDATAQLRQGVDGLNAIKNLRLLLLATERASRERAPSNGIMGDDLPHDPKKVSTLSTARQKTDAAFAELTVAIHQEMADKSGLSSIVQAAQRQLQLGRNSIDSVAGMPKAQRSPEQIRAAIDQMFLVIDDLAPASIALSNAAQSVYPKQTNFLLAARTAADLREFAGRLGSQLTVALTKRARIEVVELTAIEQIMGRIGQLHASLLERVQARPVDLKVEQATAKMQNRYFESAVPYLREQLVIGLGNADFSTDAAGFAKRYVPDMDSIIELRNVLLDEALREAQIEQIWTRRSAYLVIFLTLISVAILGAILWILEFRISRPLGKSIQLILDVAHGKLDIVVPKVKYQDELNDVLNAIEVLRNNGLARRQAESSLELKGLELSNANQALLENAAILESRVAERTTELESALLTAQSANEAKGRFLALMSHEIRTPMNGILGLAELLRTMSLDKQQAIYVKNILIAVNSLSALINDILDFSKIEAGEMNLERLVFDPLLVAEETIEFMQLQANEKNLLLDLNIVQPVPAQILNDPSRLRQVLLNLIGNAIKFTDRGGVLVSLHTSQSSLVFTIEDSGIGMSDATLTDLFEPFRQADNSIARKFGGTGLGLVICKALVEKMQGQIHVSSIQGKGSTFYVEFPLSSEVELPPKPDHKSDSNGENISGAAQSADMIDLSDLRILVVDDQPINRLIVRNQLKQIGCTFVEESHNGLEALEKLSSKQFDLVLMDVQMPEMDGLEATRLLRRLTLDSQPVVIAITANAFIEDREACLEAGMDYFIAKPIKLETLRSAIQKIIHTKAM